MEKTRINQNSQQLVNNKTRQAIDNRLPHYQLLQQSAYGTHFIINESITNTIPACICTGEPYFLEKERLTNSMLSSYGLPQLFITLTFNESWLEFQDILNGRIPSNHPWEGVQYNYKRIRNLKAKFWKTPASKQGKL